MVGSDGLNFTHSVVAGIAGKRVGEYWKVNQEALSSCVRWWNNICHLNFLGISFLERNPHVVFRSSPDRTLRDV